MLKLFESHAGSDEEKKQIKELNIEELIKKQTTVIDLLK